MGLVGRAHSPQELAEAQRILDAVRPLRQEMNLERERENSRWLEEIATLQRRVFDAFADVDLGNGDKISVRVSLTDVEVNRLEELEIAQKGEGDPDRLTDIVCEMIEIITANPVITKDWLKENREKYSPSDLLSIMLGFMEVRMRDRVGRLERIRSASSFRSDKGGTELRGSSSLSGDSRSA